MKAPDKLPPRSSEEIAADLVGIFGADQRHRIAILIDAQRQLAKFPPLVGYERSNKKFARRLKAWLEAGDEIFAAMPEDYPAFVLYAPPGPLNSEQQLLAAADLAEIRKATLGTLLGDLRSRCEAVIKGGIGEHGSAGYQQERAAIAAREMCEQTGKPLAWSSSTSPYRKAASLFYEAITGEYDHELERACEFIGERPLIKAKATQTEND
jgi:hypothetical protein